VQQFRLGKDCVGKPNNFENLAQCQLLEINCANLHGLGKIKAGINVWCMAFVAEVNYDPLPSRFANSHLLEVGMSVVTRGRELDLHSRMLFSE
jgi:hypothetical protein